jgi:hypothetical protein
MKYSLVGVDGNAYSIMGYTAKVLELEGLYDLVDEMYAQATGDDYDNLVAVCMQYVDIANDEAVENGWRDRDDTWQDFEED